MRSNETDRLTHEHRRLDLGESYPIRVVDAAELRRKISAAQANVGHAGKSSLDLANLLSVGAKHEP
jgi:hypothetical protein